MTFTGKRKRVEIRARTTATLPRRHWAASLLLISRVHKRQAHGNLLGKLLGVASLSNQLESDAKQEGEGHMLRVKEPGVSGQPRSLLSAPELSSLSFPTEIHPSMLQPRNRNNCESETLADLSERPRDQPIDAFCLPLVAPSKWKRSSAFGPSRDTSLHSQKNSRCLFGP